MTEGELIKLAVGAANKAFIDREFYIRARYALCVLQMYANKTTKSGLELYNTIDELLKKEDLDKIIKDNE